MFPSWGGLIRLFFLLLFQSKKSRKKTNTPIENKNKNKIPSKNSLSCVYLKHFLKSFFSIKPCLFWYPCGFNQEQADARSLKVSAGAERARKKWELRLQDSLVEEAQGSWEKRKDSGGSVFYRCTDPLVLDPFRL